MPPTVLSSLLHYIRGHGAGNGAQPRGQGIQAVWLAALLILSAPVMAAALDYSRQENWASRPDVPNPSMLVPVPALADRQASAIADVFYIYPTVYTSFLSSNAPIEDDGYRRAVADLLLPSQASVLNHVGRIYTPYYRQASLWTYLDTEGARKKAFDLAYADIEAAFLHYLEHDNRGRPLFLLSHSQGSQLAVRLLQENYARLRLGRILVVAYLIGERIGTRTFASLKPCAAPTRTACYVTWGTVAQGGTSDLLTGEIEGDPVCINPLSWRMDDQPVPASHHLGGVPDTFDRVMEHLVSARCEQGLLHISPAPEGFAHDGKDYHESDISLFYMDIRKDAERRLQAFR